jgi:sarcosine oxidase subunit beta
MSTWKKTADIAIIGGGIIGICSAFYLAKTSKKSIILLERKQLAQETTGLSVGGIRLQFSHPSNILLSLETVSLFERFKQEFNTDIGFRQVGYLFLAQRKKTWNEFLRSIETQRKYKVPVEILTPEETRHRWPFLKVDDLKGSTFGPRDGYADPYAVAMAFANSAKKLGVQIFEGTEVTGIRVKNGRVEGLETSQGSVSVPTIINAAGPWGGKIARMAGLNLPVNPFRRQVFITKSLTGYKKGIPMIIDFDTSFYFREEGPGILMGMSDKNEPSSYNTHVDWEFQEKVIEAALQRAPFLGEAKILRGWGGLYAVTPDENPIIGSVPEVKGFYCAIGFSGHGFQHGPPVGRILSQVIIKGKTSFDLSPFSSERFPLKNKQGENRVV